MNFDGKTLSFEEGRYAQSANSVFHFMNERKYLEDILSEKAIKPRFCVEHIEYLNLKLGDYQFDKMAVLQKCFCDIPWHKLEERCHIECVDGGFSKEECESMNNHIKLYGSYGIAFSKKWAEDNGLQPIQYINKNNNYMKETFDIINKSIQREDLDPVIVDALFNRLLFIKPIIGVMEREIKLSSGEKKRGLIKKYFHDEKEWRYVPKSKKTDYNFDCIIANPNLLNNTAINKMYELNSNIMNERYRNLWLKYDYDDIKYIIVPDHFERTEIIKFIKGDANIQSHQDTEDLTKELLISKIVVLDNMKEDV